MQNLINLLFLDHTENDDVTKMQGAQCVFLILFEGLR